MRIFPLIAVLATLAPAGALAQTVNVDQGRLDIVGEAPSACLISSPTASTGQNATLQQTGAQASEIQISQLVDPQTAQPVASSMNVALPVICNSAHRLIVRSGNGGLLREGAAGGAPVNGFRQLLPYQVTADWSGQSVTGGSETLTPVTINAADGAAGVVSLSILIPAGGDPLVAGTYSDSVVIELQVAS
jgi:hypothetical protein